MYNTNNTRGDDEMNLDNIKDMIKEVFGDEANRVRINVSGNRFKLEIKDMIHDGVWIRSANNALEQISDLYYDMACENVSWG